MAKSLTKRAFALSVLAITLPLTVMAASTNIDSTAEFRASITLQNEVPINFDVIEFAGIPSAITDSVALLPDGNMSYGGVFSGANTGVPGSVDIGSGEDGAPIEIFCDATATLANSSGATIQSAFIFVAQENSSSTLNTCAGVGALATPAFASTLDLGTWDTLLFGGIIRGSTVTGSFVGGVYTTADSANGGDPVQVDVVYQ